MILVRRELSRSWLDWTASIVQQQQHPPAPRSLEGAQQHSQSAEHQCDWAFHFENVNGSHSTKGKLLKPILTPVSKRDNCFYNAETTRSQHLRRAQIRKRVTWQSSPWQAWWTWQVCCTPPQEFSSKNLKWKTENNITHRSFLKAQIITRSHPQRYWRGNGKFYKITSCWTI